MREAEFVYLITQGLGQSLDQLPYWLALPNDILLKIVDMKAHPEQYKEQKERARDEELWDTYFPEAKL